MNPVTNKYPYFPEQWPHTDKHFRFTFAPLLEDIPTNNEEIRKAAEYLHQFTLSSLIMEHLHLWEIATERRGEYLLLYTNSMDWYALAKLQHAHVPHSPIQTLRRIESWHTTTHPLPE